MMHTAIGALIVSDQWENFANRPLITELVEQTRLPTIYPYREFVELGGLMAYAFDLSDAARGAAVHISRILQGANPSELPYSQSAKFALVINLKTAKSLGLSIPPVLLAGADEVIE